MALSTADQLRLTNLQAARDKLISGTAIAEVDYNGEKRAYAKADLGRLDREIDILVSAQQSNGGSARGHIRVRL